MSALLKHKQLNFCFRTLLLLVMTGLGLLLYIKVLEAPFVFDDQMMLAEPHLLWTELTPARLAGLSRVDIENTGSRIFANLTFAVNYYFCRHNVMGYHIVNLVIHILTAFFVFLVAGQTIKPQQRQFAPEPMLAGLLWLVHPLHVQSVTYIWQRMNSLAALFYMLSFFLYINARKKQLERSTPQKPAIYALYTGCALSGLLALGSKQTALTLPLMLIIYEWFFFQNLSAIWLRKRLLWISIVVVLAGLILLYPGTAPLQNIWSTYAGKPFTPAQRLLTEPAVILYYLSLLVWPHPGRLSLEYDFPLSTGLITPLTTLLALTALVALFAAAVHLAKRKRAAAFALLWFLITLIPESSIFGLELMWSYRTYLPSIFLVIALTGYLPESGRMRRPAVIVFASCIIICGIWTFQRNNVWTGKISLWQDTVKKSPASARAWNGLGNAYQDKSSLEDALRCFKKSVKLKPDYCWAYNNIGCVLREMGRPDQAVSYFKKTLAINPEFRFAYYNLGLAMRQMDNMEKAIQYFKRALRIKPDYARAHKDLGTVLLEKNRPDKAFWHLKQALEINPALPEANNNLGALLAARGNTKPAVKHFELAIKHSPAGFAEAHYNLANILFKSGTHNKALSHYKKTLAIDPDYDQAAAVHYHMGLIMDGRGKTENAVSYFKLALSLEPGHTKAASRLADLYKKTDRFDQAIRLYQNLIKHRPDCSASIAYNLACLYALKNDRKTAVNWLKKSIENGLSHKKILKTDRDLDNIRKTPYFRFLIGSPGS